MRKQRASAAELDSIEQRKPARRIAEVPPRVLAALDRGETETRNLVEFLAVDVRALLAIALRSFASAAQSHRALEVYEPYAQLGVMKRLQGAGRALFEAARGRRDRARVFAALASHRSDVVRELAACWLLADDQPTLELRLAAARRFAADAHSGVREVAWFAIRPHVASELELGLALLDDWVRDRDPNVRRTAIEATRPRGVWTAHIERLKREPELARPLLDRVARDPARYVQNAVGNWINDAAKSRPEWARETCARWSIGSSDPATAYVVRRALRSIDPDGSRALDGARGLARAPSTKKRRSR